MRILIIEDDGALREMLVRRLQREGYAVDASGDGIEGLDYALSTIYDGILLDIMLPGMDGLSLLSALRARNYAGGILLLTARDAVADRVRGLDSGADDYLVKPFSYEELSARLRALLRKHTPSHATVLREGGLELDTVTHIVRRDGKQVELTAKEFALLEYMLRNSRQVLTPSQIFDHVWNYASSLDTNLVPVYIGYLRKKIDQEKSTRYIHTVRGMGYMLCEERE